MCEATEEQDEKGREQTSALPSCDALRGGWDRQIQSRDGVLHTDFPHVLHESMPTSSAVGLIQTLTDSL